MTGMAPVTMQGNAAPVRLGVCSECMRDAAAWDGAGWGGELATTSGTKIHPVTPISRADARRAGSLGGCDEKQTQSSPSGGWATGPMSEQPNPVTNTIVRGSGGERYMGKRE
eukprot:1216298-Rhodomonas_salina.1